MYSYLLYNEHLIEDYGITSALALIYWSILSYIQRAYSLKNNSLVLCYKTQIILCLMDAILLFNSVFIAV